MADTALVIEGVKETLAVMRKAEPEMYKALRADIRGIIQPAVSSIQSRVPKVAPLNGNQFGVGGMNHAGRTRYATPKVTIGFTPSKRSKFSAVQSLASVKVASPSGAVGFEIVDMAGRGTGKGRKATTRSRGWDTHPKGYRKNGQSDGIYQKLGRRASRYVYPAVESQRIAIETGIRSTIKKYEIALSRRLAGVK